MCEQDLQIICARVAQPSLPNFILSFVDIKTANPKPSLIRNPLRSQLGKNFPCHLHGTVQRIGRSGKLVIGMSLVQRPTATGRRDAVRSMLRPTFNLKFLLFNGRQMSCTTVLPSTKQMKCQHMRSFSTGHKAHIIRQQIAKPSKKSRVLNIADRLQIDTQCVRVRTRNRSLALCSD